MSWHADSGEGKREVEASRWGSRAYLGRRLGKKLKKSLDIDLINACVTQNWHETSEDTKSRGRYDGPITTVSPPLLLRPSSSRNHSTNRTVKKGGGEG